MKKAYQTCGKFDAAKKTISVQTNLPDPTLNFRYEGFFNFSTDKVYIIVGVLVDDRNADYSQTPSNLLTPQVLNAGAVDLKLIYRTFSTRTFDQLADSDTILFICWHDNEFNSLTATSVNSTPAAFAANYLPQMLKMLIPKVGDGGILTFDGSC